MVDALQVTLALLVGFLMLGLGATLTVHDFKRTIRSWKGPLIGFGCQFVLMPLIALVLALALDVPKATGLSMLVVGTSPGGSTSNLFTHLSKGDLALSIAMTVVSTTCALGMMPLWLAILGPVFSDDNVKIDFVSVLSSLLLVLIPVAIGIAVRHKSEAVASILEKIASVLGAAFIVVAIVVGLSGDAWILQSRWQVWFAAITFLFFGAGAGYGTARLLSLTKRQARTVSLETGIQNSTLSLTILAFTFPESENRDLFRAVARFPLLYSLFLVIDSVALTALYRYWARSDPQQEPEKDAEGTDVAPDAATHAQDEEADPHASPVPAQRGDSVDKDGRKEASV